MPHLVVAPDKFRGTASAAEVAAAAAGAARRAGWTADEVPMSDGGEGLLDALGGEPRHTTVTGPLGRPVDAEWRLLADTPHGRRPTATPPRRSPPSSRCPRPPAVPSSPTRRTRTPSTPTPTGVGQLLLAARDAGARRIVIGCGGSATTDGGWGAFAAVTADRPDDAPPHASRSDGVELVVACDVTTPFLQAATVFGPQKGATEEQIARLTARLEDVAARYRTLAGVDVTTIARRRRRRRPGRRPRRPGRPHRAGLRPGGPHRAPGRAPRPRPTSSSPARATSTRPASRARSPAASSTWPAPARTAHGGPLPVVCIGGGADRSVLAHPPPGLEVVSLSADTAATGPAARPSSSSPR